MDKNTFDSEIASDVGDATARGRVYIHAKCHQPTGITGQDWVRLCNPFAQTMGTYCTHCKTSSSLKEFSWKDSGENLLRYVRRLRSTVPIFWRHWFWWIGPLCGAVIFAIVFFLVGPLIPTKNPLPAEAWAAIGAFFGLFLMPVAVTPWLVPRVTGIEFYRQR